MTPKPLTGRAPLAPPLAAIALSTNKQKKTNEKKPPNRTKWKKNNKRFSQMKKFTFIRFIEPAEREEIGIGHYGAGRGTGRGRLGESGKEGARKPLSRACGKRRLEGCVCSCLVSALGLVSVRLALRWRRVTQEEAGAAQREQESEREALRAGEGGGGRGVPCVFRRQAGGQLPAHHDMTTRDHGVPTTPL